MWGHQGTGIGAAIYRQSRVGINQQNPLYQLDVNGDLHASANVQFDATLNVNGSVQLNNTIDEKIIASHWGVIEKDTFYWILPAFSKPTDTP